MHRAVFFLALISLPGRYAMAENKDQQSVELINAAVHAHGGAERLKREFVRCIDGKGCRILNGKEMAFQFESWVLMPSQSHFRLSAIFEADPAPVRMILITNDRINYCSLNGVEEVISEKQIANARAMKRMIFLSSLVPLLSDAKCSLEYLGSSSEGNRTLVGVRVIDSKTRFELYFDNSTKLLRRHTYRSLDGNNKECEISDVIDEYREVEGIKMASKWRQYFNGNLDGVFDNRSIQIIEKSLRIFEK